jgi:hypothetical protein
MADNYLITGYWGEPHVTAENDRGINASIFGTGKFVLPVGEQFRAEYIGNNTVRMYDGKLMNNGAAAGIPVGEYVDLLIANAGQGMKRNDLIVFQYSQDASTLIESGKFVVIQGAEVSGTASDPTLAYGDLLSNRATFDQMALWRIPVFGTTISAPVKLFSLYKNNSTHSQEKNNPHAVSAKQIGAALAGYGYGDKTNATPINGDANRINVIGNYQGNTNCPTDDQWYIATNIHQPGVYEQQTAIRAYDGSVCMRIKVDGVWHNWKWDNPPMLNGVEYETTERRNGNTVYTKYIDGIQMNGTGYKNVPIGNSADMPLFPFREDVSMTNVAGTKGMNRPECSYLIDGDTKYLRIEMPSGEDFANAHIALRIWYTKH